LDWIVIFPEPRPSPHEPNSEPHHTNHTTDLRSANNKRSYFLYLFKIVLMNKIFLFVLLLPVYCSAQSINNLDVKNGFLQFHLGDSISRYKDYVYIPLKNHPNQNEVRPKAFSLYKHIDRVTLISENGILTEIDLMIRDEPNMVFIDDLLTKAYGPGSDINNEVRNDPGMYLTYTRWIGKRVTALLIQTNINKVVNKTMTRGRYQSVVFTKTGDVQVDGALPNDFAL
jgi:hypothetical protein